MYLTGCRRSQVAGDSLVVVVINMVWVVFLSSIPTFVGEDLNNYGPFNEGDIANIPPRVAGVLVYRGVAMYLEQPPSD